MRPRQGIRMINFMDEAMRPFDLRDFCAGLAARGFGKGDVFAILSPNALEYALAFHGATHAGGVVTTINPLYTADEVAHQLADAGAKFLLTAPACLEKATAAITEYLTRLTGTPFMREPSTGARSPHRVFAEQAFTHRVEASHSSAYRAKRHWIVCVP